MGRALFQTEPIFAPQTRSAVLTAPKAWPSVASGKMKLGKGDLRKRDTMHPELAHKSGAALP